MKLLVRPTPRTALPGDEPVVLDDSASEAATSRALVGEVRRDGGLDVVEVLVDGWRFELEVEPAARAELRRRATRDRAGGTGSGPQDIRAVIPGRVVSVAVAAGETVATGQPLLVLEAMKMQNELRAPRDGTVGRVAVAAGTTVELGDTLLVLE
jgi:biotin carboxyl carrier protein